MTQYEVGTSHRGKYTFGYVVPAESISEAKYRSYPIYRVTIWGQPDLTFNQRKTGEWVAVGDVLKEPHTVLRITEDNTNTESK